MPREEDVALVGLYYPFSRPIGLGSLKQMLLVFDSIHFLDAVDDEEWRGQLFNSLSVKQDRRFAAYKEVQTEMQSLLTDGVAQRVDPRSIQSIHNLGTGAATLSDLLDEDWTRLASKPWAFDLPHAQLGTDGTATWDIFKPKIPASVINALESASTMEKHLIWKGDEETAWTLSYEAGSAIAINAHLCAAEELSVAPITDSALHHKLLLMKILRNGGEPELRARPISSKVAKELARSTMIHLIDELIPVKDIDRISVEEILRFRESTKDVRLHAAVELERRIGALSSVPTYEDLMRASKEIRNSINNDLRSYRAEMCAARNKV
jgi:hypothetical protein